MLVLILFTGSDPAPCSQRGAGIWLVRRAEQGGCLRGHTLRRKGNGRNFPLASALSELQVRGANEIDSSF